jgi:asparagine synthase (glutamine-hydrolysing)
MCGICGIAGPSEARVPLGEHLIQRMQDSIIHRGPDDGGAFTAPGIALGSRRLSILDLSPLGHMPMSTEDGRYTIAYNGEVYNFQSLREDLKRRGFTFQSGTDTEVVLKSFVADGPQALSRFNGMFAIAIWDAVERTLFLARDRLGIKPLYYASHDHRLYFASEPKALFRAGVPATFDASAWPELLLFRYRAGKRTVFEGVDRLLPGHYAIVKDGRITERRWWNLAERIEHHRTSSSFDSPESFYRSTFDDAVRLRKISDVPVGIMLSGGLDSSSVAASLSLQGHRDLAAFTVGFKERGYDERALAREVAERYGYRFHEILLDENDLLERFRHASWVHDEPLAHSNDGHMLALSEYAKRHVTVLLSGEGADETLNGYVRYQPLRAGPLALTLLSRQASRFAASARLPHRARKLARYLKLSTEHLPIFNACDVYPSELTELGVDAASSAVFPYRQGVLEEARSVYPGDLLRQAMYVDQHSFLCSLLDRNDRMTMGASIECRVPFLDYRLVEAAAALPTRAILRGGQRKAILRRSIGDRLPASIRSAKKWGFGVPWGTYLRRVPELVALVRRLSESEAVKSAPLSRGKIDAMCTEFLAGDPRHEPIVKELMLVAIWHESYFPRIKADLRAVS